MGVGSELLVRNRRGYQLLAAAPSSAISSDNALSIQRLARLCFAPSANEQAAISREKNIGCQMQPRRYIYELTIVRGLASAEDGGEPWALLVEHDAGLLLVQAEQVGAAADHDAAGLEAVRGDLELDAGQRPAVALVAQPARRVAHVARVDLTSAKPMVHSLI